MKNFQASAVERRITVQGEFASHPMEAGWASEAIFFLIIEEMGASALLDAHVEISSDRINWIPEGTSFEPIDRPGHYFAKVSHFGNWLRINGRLPIGATAKLSIHLHLKG